MRERMKRWMLKVLMAVCTFTAVLTPVQSNAAVKITKAKVLIQYQNYFRDHTFYDCGYGQRLAFFEGRYKVVDIDRNGVPDLMYNYHGRMMLFTYNKKTKKVVRVKYMASQSQYNAPMYYNSKKKMFVMVTSDNYGSQTYRFFKLSGTKVSSKGTCSCTNSTYGKTVYRVKGKVVSRSKYNKQVKIMLKGYVRTAYY
ncbi:MAG: hypothetical protein IJH71_09190 [Eubacterium sp.]|nr:hypothetical protein [Eubacterium sp.]